MPLDTNPGAFGALDSFQGSIPGVRRRSEPRMLKNRLVMMAGDSHLVPEELVEHRALHRVYPDTPKDAAAR